MLAASAPGVLFLGLTAANVDRLVSGYPIRLSRETHGMAIPADLTILIAVGESEDTLAADLRRIGAIGDATVINQQRPL